MFKSLQNIKFSMLAVTDFVYPQTVHLLKGLHCWFWQRPEQCFQGCLWMLEDMIQDFYDHATVEMARRWVEERERAGRHLRRPGEADQLKLLDPDLDDRRIVLGADGVLRVEVA